jgi:hypothetical protein
MSAVGPRAIAGLGVLVALAILSAPADGAEFENYAVESVSASLSSTQAGAHADLSTAFQLTEKEGEPYALTRDISVALPPGVVGNPQAIPPCSVLQLGRTTAESQCPQDSQVGVSEITLGGANSGTLIEPVYNMQPPGGEIVARLGFFAGPYPFLLGVKVDPTDYGLVASLEGASGGASLIAASTTLWGVPAATSHDSLRLTPAEALNQETPLGGRKSGLPPAPFMTNPTACATPRQISVTATSYALPGAPSTKAAAFPAIVGCGSLSFEPTFTLAPTSDEAAAPSGVDADLRIPQDETPGGRATSTLRSAAVTLPEGLTINPAAADGLEACSRAQVGFETSEPARCPAGAKIGGAEIEVPALEHVLHGSVYQRMPEPGHLFRFWLVSDELGVHLKLPAEIEADPQSGRLRTLFDGIPALGGNPQVPVADLKLHVFGGPRAPLATPASCGTYRTHYEFSPWSGNAAASGDTPMSVGAGCGKGGFSPTLTAGTLDPEAGRFSPFVLRVTRADGEANISVLETIMPQGLLAKLGGVPLCAEAAAASAECSPSSQIGSLSAAAGVGGDPLWIPQPGRAPTAVYLAGPYKGAPYSVITRVPAQAGPFDLGTVVTRAGIYVDPETAVARIRTDPLPQILAGVPIAYRDLDVSIDRPDFTLNPTGCTRRSVQARIVAIGGALATPSDRFRAIDCAKLGFAPRLSLSLSGSVLRAQHPALKAVLTQESGQANIARATVTLPPSEIIEQAHVGNPCTRPQFEANACPAQSLLGYAKAITPLLDQPLEGPVYFRANGGARELPDIVADLRGPIHIVLVGFVDSVRRKGAEISRLRATFAAVPDAPVRRFTMDLFGGKRGLLVNSTNLCAAPRRAAVKLTAQNGRADDFEPTVRTDCGKRRK